MAERSLHTSYMSKKTDTVLIAQYTGVAIRGSKAEPTNYSFVFNVKQIIKGKPTPQISLILNPENLAAYNTHKGQSVQSNLENFFDVKSNYIIAGAFAFVNSNDSQMNSYYPFLITPLE